ncbi:MAG: hypothetical protein JKY01_10040 [Pseudomonadales bacterium]|nr:hypothetical protein [Pseudomonadales bacterium]
MILKRVNDITWQDLLQIESPFFACSHVEKALFNPYDHYRVWGLDEILNEDNYNIYPQAPDRRAQERLLDRVGSGDFFLIHPAGRDPFSPVVRRGSTGDGEAQWVITEPHIDTCARWSLERIISDLSRRQEDASRSGPSAEQASSTPPKPARRAPRSQGKTVGRHEESSSSDEGSTVATIAVLSKAIHPKSLADAENILNNRRKQIAAEGYKPKYNDDELLDLAKNGDISSERFQVRFMKEDYLVDSDTPDIPLSGKLGTVMKGETGEGAKYWSTSFDQLEDADSDPKLISQKLGLPYDPKATYVLVVVDTQKSTPITGAKTVPATFDKVGEFANTELPKTFPPSFTDKAMTPAFQARYTEHYNAAVESGALPNDRSKDSKKFEKYLQGGDLSQDEQDLMIKRMEMHAQIGNNQDYVGNGLTKDLISNSPNAFGVVETLNFERRMINLKQLQEAGAITIIKGLKPL